MWCSRMPASAQLAPFGSVEEKFYDLHFNANVKGLFFTIQKSLPLVNDGASIILNASIATVKGFPGISVYSATKAAVRSFARTWTNELRERRIRVNAISPGHIDTPIFQSWQQGDELRKMKRYLAKKTFRLAGSEILTKSPKPSRFSRRMKRVRHPPQSGWLDELGRLKGGRSVGLGVARCAPYWVVQNCPAAPSAVSCSRMYVRTCSSSNPTVDTA